jgi:hypothetical protein
MKTIIFFILFLVTLNNAISQDENFRGIYLTANDFENNNLHLKGDKKQVKINANFPFKLSQVRVKAEGKKFYFHKDSIWGILDGERVYRFINSANYELIANSGILMYSYRDNGRHMKLFFYFSRSASDPVLPLTIKNLEKAFSGNTKFIGQIHGKMKKDEDLAAFDKTSNSYNIVNLYNLSLQK